MPRLCEVYPGICLTTEEKARKNLSQVRTSVGKEPGTLHGLESRSGISGGDKNLMLLQGFEPRSVKHVPSRWTGSAIPGQKKDVVDMKCKRILLTRISRYLDVSTGPRRIAMGSCTG